MKTLFIILQQISIDEKIKAAPTSAYQIGVLIGSYLPLVLLFGLAYFIYYKNKKD